MGVTIVGRLATTCADPRVLCCWDGSSLVAGIGSWGSFADITSSASTYPSARGEAQIRAGSASKWRYFKPYILRYMTPYRVWTARTAHGELRTLF